MLSVVLKKQRSVCLRSGPKTSLVQRFNSNKSIEEREKTFEDKNVREHDRRLAEEYAKRLEVSCETR
jgi:hypothetical protein